MCTIADQLLVADGGEMELSGIRFGAWAGQEDWGNSLQRHGPTAIVEDKAGEGRRIFKAWMDTIRKKELHYG